MRPLLNITALSCLATLLVLAGCEEYKYGGEYNSRLVVHALKSSPTFPADPFPMRVYIDGELMGEITAIDSSYVSKDDLCENPDRPSVVYIDGDYGNHDIYVNSPAGNYSRSVWITHPQECFVATIEM